VGAAVVVVGWLLLAGPIAWLVDRGRATALRPLLESRRAESVPDSS
jgi:hypothetical protein